MVDKRLNYGRKQIVELAGNTLSEKRSNDKVRILDIGAGNGSDLSSIGQILENKCLLEKYGIENYKPKIKKLLENNVKVSSLNIEKDLFPFDDNYFDLVVANQVLEHTKEIFWIVSEVSRILKPNGTFIVGVPNLASLHNRLLLFWGRQPTNIKTLSAHIRGFTYEDFKNFIETDGYFKVCCVKGSNFYPFPASLANPLARLFPLWAWGLFFAIRRTSKQGKFIEVLKTRFFETNYYIGNGKTLFDGFDD